MSVRRSRGDGLLSDFRTLPLEKLEERIPDEDLLMEDDLYILSFLDLHLTLKKKST